MKKTLLVVACVLSALALAFFVAGCNEITGDPGQVYTMVLDDAKFLVSQNDAQNSVWELTFSRGLADHVKVIVYATDGPNIYHLGDEYEVTSYLYVNKEGKSETRFRVKVH